MEDLIGYLDEIHSLTFAAEIGSKRGDDLATRRAALGAVVDRVVKADAILIMQPRARPAMGCRVGEASTLRSRATSMYIPQMSQPTPCACTTLRKAARAVTRFYDAAIERAGMTTTQFAVLRAAERAGTVTMSRVADDLVMDRTSLYRTVAPLLREGWLRCASSDDDARAKCLVVTPLGRRRIAWAAKEWDAAQARVVAHIGRRRWGRLSTSLLEIAEQVHRWTPEKIA